MVWGLGFRVLGLGFMGLTGGANLVLINSGARGDLRKRGAFYEAWVLSSLCRKFFGALNLLNLKPSKGSWRWGMKV